MKKAIIAIGVLISNGCALLNPYESSFSCPESRNGKCVSVQTAYSESATGQGVIKTVTDTVNDLRNSDNVTVTSSSGDEKLTPQKSASTEISSLTRYQSALFDKFSGLLKDPVTPVVAPPKTMRVLLLPYTGQDNEFYMLRYVYFFVDEPRWLLGDSVSSGEEE